MASACTSEPFLGKVDVFSDCWDGFGGWFEAELCAYSV